MLRRLATREGFTGPTDYVFCGRMGERLDGTAIGRRYQAACRAAGLRRVKLHALRHAAGSIAARELQGAEVQAILGHSSSRTTDRYVRAKVSAEMRGRLDRAYSPSDNSPTRR